jgi:hypothetical protein
VVTIDSFLIDAVTQENHDYSNEVTQHPIEKGGTSTDHVIKRPRKLSLDCIVSNTPIGVAFDARTSDALPTVEAFALLYNLRDSGKAITVVTELLKYENMIIETVSIPRSIRDGESLQFKLTLIQADFVESERTRITVRVPRHKKKVNKGQVATQNPADGNVPDAAAKTKERVTTPFQDVLSLGAPDKGISQGLKNTFRIGF